MRGIDVSYAQGEIDWAAVKKSGQVDFALLRCGYGWGERQQDSQFAANAAGCAAQGVPFGVYHYSYALTPEQARQEAKSCLEIIGAHSPQWPVAFDFEETKQLALPLWQQLEIIEAFLSEMEEAGYFGVLYMSASSLERLYRAFPERVKRYALWVAHVGADKPSTTAPWGIWQYSWEGKVPGIWGAVDLNEAVTDYEAVIRKAGLNRPKGEPGAPDYRALYEQKSRELEGLVDTIKALIERYEEE